MKPSAKDIRDRAVCFMFGDASPRTHWSKRFYLVRSMQDGWWYIRRHPTEEGAWSRRYGGIWTAFAREDVENCQFQFTAGWKEAERILAGKMHDPAWQMAKMQELTAEKDGTS